MPGSEFQGWYHEDAGVIISRIWLALDFGTSAISATELALVLGTELLGGEGPSPGTSGGVGAAEVLIGGGGKIDDGRGLSV